MERKREVEEKMEKEEEVGTEEKVIIQSVNHNFYSYIWVHVPNVIWPQAHILANARKVK